MERITHLGALMVALVGAGCAHAAGDDPFTYVGGAGGEGAEVSSSHSATSTHAVTSTSGNGNPTSVGPSTSAAGPSTGTGATTCDSLDCASCQNCAFSAGAQCAASYDACMANQDCMAFGDCLNACPYDDLNTPNDEQLDCICSNDGLNCDGNLTPGTCIGDHASGMEAYSAVGECIFTVACPNACN